MKSWDSGAYSGKTGQEEKEMRHNRGSLRRRAKSFTHSLVPAFVPQTSWVLGVKQGSRIIMRETDTVSTVSEMGLPYPRRRKKPGEAARRG